MKVVLSGATGFIGGNILKRLLELPSVTSVIVLSRRKVEVSHAKIETIIVKEFNQYDESTLARLEGAEAVLWYLGAASSGEDVHYGYTMAAAKAFEKSLLPRLPQGKKLTFVYGSGAIVERDQEKTLFFMGEWRKIRGRTERELIDIQNQHPNQWQTVIAKPELVINGEPLWRYALGGHCISVGELAAVLVDTALNNGGDKQTLDNSDLRERGKAALRES